jgi:ADP-heptose:LPS heptosyltransferase
MAARPHACEERMDILLIRLRLIGDVIFTTPAIRAVRRRFPDARIAYLVEPGAEPVVRGNPHLDEVIVASRPSGLARSAADVALAARLRRRRFGMVIDFHGGPRSSWMTWASGAPRRIGYAIPGRGWMYTERVERPRALRPRHSVLNQWDLIRPLGVPEADPRRDATEMVEDPAAASAVASKLATLGTGPDSQVIVVHVSAGNAFRRWPEEHFVHLTAGLAAGRSNRRIVVSSGPSDEEAAARVVLKTRDLIGEAGADTVVTWPDLDLAGVRALLSRAALYIGGDSGPLHIAGTTGVPIVALFGPTLAVRSAPWRDPVFFTEAVEPDDLDCRPCNQRRCAPGDFRCLSSISADTVRRAAERALQRGGAAPLPAGLQ